MLNNFLNKNKYWFIGIVGSTKRHEKRKIKELLQERMKKYDDKTIIVVSGGAKGIDTDSEIICKQLGIPYLVFPPKKANFIIEGDEIYFKRNYHIARIANEIIHFPLGYNDGSRNTVRYFRELKKEGNIEKY